jgi:HrpA-like RNA helicase
MSSGNEASPRISSKNKERILRSVDHNRVTIIVGSTGSGKSTLIPPLILDELPSCRTKPVLCSQPRRLAVVAIAKRVAETRRLQQREQRNGGDPPETGRHHDRRYSQHEEVGYHVGNQNFSTNHTRLCFTTAGILLEQLRANGISILNKFGVIIIDECHERSPESDLVMALIKHFMLTNPKDDSVRIILMSATFDSHRYQRFFQHVPGCSTVDIIPLETAQTFCAYYNQVQDLYLEDIVKELPQSEIVTSLMRPFLKDPNEDLHYNQGKELSPNLLFLIHQLVSWLDETEESKDAPFLIFAPTYRHLEQLHTGLERITTLKLHVLHSSVGACCGAVLTVLNV